MEFALNKKSIVELRKMIALVVQGRAVELGTKFIELEVLDKERLRYGLIAPDFSLSAQGTLPIANGKPGKSQIACDMLGKIFNAATASELLNFKLNKYKFAITSDKGNYELTIGNENIPKHPEVTGPSFKLNGTLLHELLQRGSVATTKDGDAQATDLARLAHSEGVVWVESFNQRVSTRALAATGASKGDNVEVLLPQRSMSALSLLTNDQDCVLTVGNNRWKLEREGVVATGALDGRKLTTMQTFIERGGAPPPPVSVSIKELSDLITRVYEMDEDYRRAKLNIAENKLTLHVRYLQGKNVYGFGEVFMPITHSVPMEAFFGLDALRAALQPFAGSETVMLGVRSTAPAWLMQKFAQVEVLALLMPMSGW